jgi:hypothetical protein
LILKKKRRTDPVKTWNPGLGPGRPPGRVLKVLWYEGCILTSEKEKINKKKSDRPAAAMLGSETNNKS